MKKSTLVALGNQVLALGSEAQSFIIYLLSPARRLRKLGNISGTMPHHEAIYCLKEVSAADLEHGFREEFDDEEGSLSGDEKSTLVDFGTYLLSTHRREHILTTYEGKVPGEVLDYILTQVDEVDLKEWQRISASDEVDSYDPGDVVGYTPSGQRPNAGDRCAVADSHGEGPLTNNFLPSTRTVDEAGRIYDSLVDIKSKQKP